MGIRASVGFKLSSKKDVIAVTGDGSFIFGVPEAFYYIAQQHSPILVVIYINGGWLAARESVEHVFPEGLDKVKSLLPGVDLKRYDIGKTVEAFNGFYKLAEEALEIREALYQGLRELKRGRTAVIQVIVDKVM